MGWLRIGVGLAWRIGMAGWGGERCGWGACGGAARRWDRSCRGEPDPSAQVEGDRGEEDLGCRLLETDVADLGEAHAVFPRGKGGLDRGAPVGDEPVVAGEPSGQPRVVLVGPAHQPGLHPARPQRPLARMGVVGRIAPHHPLVAADQPVGRGRVVDVCRGRDDRADEPRAFIDPDMRLVAKGRAPPGLGA